MTGRVAEQDALDRIRTDNEAAGRWVVVLDDDPTGSQTMSDAAVLLAPATDDLVREARERRPTFVWTNTRALPEARAVEVTRALVRSVLEAAATAGVRAVLVSRGDSTLRGHFAAEVTAVVETCAAAGRPVDGVVFAPAFLEAGRITADDVQWVRQADGRDVPAARTEFAEDATFGYTEVDLRHWVAVRMSRPGEQITSIPLDALGTPAPAQVLAALHDGAVVVANAASAADLELLVLAGQEAERAGRHLVYRSGPSLVRVLAGQRPHAVLTASDLTVPGQGGVATGLTVVGSHTELTTRQLDAATAEHPLRVVELDVDAVLDPGRRDDVRRDVVERLKDALHHGHAALVTSRGVRSAPGDRPASLAIAGLVSDAVCAAVGDLAADVPLAYVVAKGGITSHEVAARGLGMRRATVLGQLFAGQVSVLRLGPETPLPGVPYVVFPGNVGRDDALASVLTTLTAEGRP